tara:strand:+ start:340 stop:609 length:270 start_codon:yes stop_codon:yes gene_type:complete
MLLEKSQRKDKRFVIQIDNKKIHFGAKNGFTYVDGASEKTRENYIKRHRVNEDWNNINAGSLSRFILWGDTKDINKNLKAFLTRVSLSV